MKSLLRILILSSVAVLIAACSTTATPTAIPTVVLGSGAPSSGSSSEAVTASGEIVPEPKAALSFPLTGSVLSVDVHAGDEVTKDQPLIQLDPAIWSARADEAEGALAVAKADEAYLVRTGADQEHIDAASADVERAAAALKAAQAILTQATLTAPFNGTIASVDTAEAETVVAGQEVIMLGDLSNFQVVTTDLGERDIPAVKIGQAATITVNALGQDFPAKVTDIARIASTIGGDVVYKVTLQFDTQPHGLMWGMTAEVRIQAGG